VWLGGNLETLSDCEGISDPSTMILSNLFSMAAWWKLYIFCMLKLRILFIHRAAQVNASRRPSHWEFKANTGNRFFQLKENWLKPVSKSKLREITWLSWINVNNGPFSNSLPLPSISLWENFFCWVKVKSDWCDMKFKKLIWKSDKKFVL